MTTIKVAISLVCISNQYLLMNEGSEEKTK